MKRTFTALLGAIGFLSLGMSASLAEVTVLGWPGGPEETALRKAAEVYNGKAATFFPMGKTAAILMSLCTTCKNLKVDPLAYLTDVLERIVSGRTKSHQLHELLAWNWKVARQRIAQAAA